MSLTNEIGHFVEGISMNTLPKEVIKKARICLLNGYGIGIGCHNTPYAPTAELAAKSLSGSISQNNMDCATIFLSGEKTSILGATLANSAMFHGRGQEDTCGSAHLGAIVIPMLTALIEARHYPIDRLIPALVAGYETGGLLEFALANFTTPKGIRGTAMYGSLAAAAAAAKVMNLPADRIAAAIANAANFGGGTLQSIAEGTDECRYQVGMAGITGLISAELAAAGSISSLQSLEGSAGLSFAYGGVQINASSLMGKLGNDWSISRVTFKPFPVCAFNQTPVIAALELRKFFCGRVPTRVKVRMNPYETGYAGMGSKGPFNTITGTLMSIPFCVALTVLHGEPSMAAMVKYDDEAVIALVQKTELISDDKVNRLSCVIDVEFSDGTSISREQPMTTKDFDFDHHRVVELVRRIGSEEGVPQTAYDAIEDFVTSLPNCSISNVVEAFSLIPARGNL